MGENDSGSAMSTVVPQSEPQWQVRGAWASYLFFGKHSDPHLLGAKNLMRT